jgi:hypothetical protein
MVSRTIRERAEAYVDPLAYELREREHGQILDHFQVVIAVGIFLAVGVIVTAQIFAALPTDQTGPLYNATDDIESGLADAFIIGAILPIVIVGMLMLRVMRGA